MKMDRKTFLMKKGERVRDPMEDVLTHVNDSNIVLETTTSWQAYLSIKRPWKKIAEESSVKKPVET